jgi:hypothetical protein
MQGFILCHCLTVPGVLMGSGWDRGGGGVEANCLLLSLSGCFTGWEGYDAPGGRGVRMGSGWGMGGRWETTSGSIRRLSPAGAAQPCDKEL